MTKDVVRGGNQMETEGGSAKDRKDGGCYCWDGSYGLTSGGGSKHSS